MTRDELIKELAKHSTPSDWPDEGLGDVDIDQFREVLFEYQEANGFNERIEGLWDRTARQLFDFYPPVLFLSALSGTLTEDEIVEGITRTNPDDIKDNGLRFIKFPEDKPLPLSLMGDIHNLCKEIRAAMEKDDED